MRTLLLSALMLVAFAATAQEIVDDFDGIENPPIQQVFGDLDNDGIDDLVILTRELIDNPDSVIDEANYVLNILRGTGDSQYEPWKYYDQSFSVLDDENIEISFDLEIKRGTLHIGVGSWASSGTYSVDNTVFVFRYQDGDFFLIGKEISTFARNTGEGYTDSFNYLTHKKVRSTFNAFEEGNTAKGKPEWSKLEKEPLKSLSAFRLYEEW